MSDPGVTDADDKSIDELKKEIEDLGKEIDEARHEADAEHPKGPHFIDGAEGADD